RPSCPYQDPHRPRAEHYWRQRSPEADQSPNARREERFRHSLPQDPTECWFRPMRRHSSSSPVIYWIHIHLPITVPAVSVVGVIPNPLMRINSSDTICLLMTPRNWAGGMPVHESFILWVPPIIVGTIVRRLDGECSPWLSQHLGPIDAPLLIP